jgi:Domain of unknown function (DUF4468) with TBP-like fold
MKTFAVACLVLVMVGCASAPPGPPVDPTYQTVIDAPGLTAAQVYNRALAWVSETFVSAKAVIDLADPSTGRIVCRPATGFSYLTAYIHVSYKLIIECRDGRVRFTAGDWRGDGASAGWGTITQQGGLRKLTAEAASSADQLRAYLAKPADKW